MAKDFPTYTTTAKTGNKGMRMVGTVVNDELGWLLRSQEDQSDLGIDAHIELLGSNGEAYGRLLAAQVKCGKTFFRTSNSDGYVFYGESKHLNYYLNYSLPVILILCDPVKNQCWWSEIDPLETEKTNTGWKITVPFDQHFDLSAKEPLMKIAGPAQDYHEELEQYWMTNELLTMPKDYFDIVIAREDIEKQDISRVLSVLQRFRSSKKVIRSNKEQISVSVYGYEEDERELYEIPEVRSWFSQLCKEFHYWFYFLNKKTGALKLIVACILPYAVISKDFVQKQLQIELDMSGLGPFLESNFVGLNEICTTVGFGENEIWQISKSTFSVIFPGYSYPPL